MRLGVVSSAIVAVCLSGCGGMVVLHSDQGSSPPPPPAPQTVPVYGHHELNRDEAVQVVAARATRNHLVRLHVEDVERSKNEWSIELRGFDSCGAPVKARGRVNRWSGELKSFKLKDDGDGHHDHGKGHQHHDGHDD